MGCSAGLGLGVIADNVINVGLAIGKQSAIERAQDLTAMRLGPPDRVVMRELPVLGIGAVDFQAHRQRAGGELALWSDVVAGEVVSGFAAAHCATR